MIECWRLKHRSWLNFRPRVFLTFFVSLPLPNKKSIIYPYLLAFFVSFTPCQMKKIWFTPIFLAVYKFLRILRWSPNKGLQFEKPPNSTILEVISPKNRKPKIFFWFSTNFPDLVGLLLIFRAVLFWGYKNIAQRQSVATLSLFLILKFEVCFSLWFSKFTPSVRKIYPQGINLPG